MTRLHLPPQPVRAQPLSPKELHDAAMGQNASASRPWALASVGPGSSLTLHGWYTTRGDARTVGMWLDLSRPIIARMYSREELAAIVSHSSPVTHSL